MPWFHKERIFIWIRIRAFDVAVVTLTNDNPTDIITLDILALRGYESDFSSTENKIYFIGSTTDWTCLPIWLLSGFSDGDKFSYNIFCIDIRYKILLLLE